MKRKQYQAAVVDDNDHLREVVLECLRFSDIHADGYAEAEELLERISRSNQQAPDTVPDLIVVDLELKSGMMQGLDLIAQLVAQDVPSEIIAITGHHSSSELVENAVCFGAASIVTKPFVDIFAFARRAEQIARIGHGRRLSRAPNANKRRYDQSRRHRPVFLSYSTIDSRFANGIRRNIEIRGIGVWYAPTTVDIGDEWRHRIKTGIDEAFIFVPLITDQYLDSPFCVGELTRFYRRIRRDRHSELTILPVFAGLSAERRHDQLVKRILQDYHGIEFSPRITDGLTVLLASIQQRVLGAKRPNKDLQPAAARAIMRRRG